MLRPLKARHVIASQPGETTSNLRSQTLSISLSYPNELLESKNHVDKNLRGSGQVSSSKTRDV